MEKTLLANKFELKNIADIFAVLIVFGLIIAFFVRKKSVKLILLYSFIYAFYISVVVIDYLFNLPIAKSVADVLIIFMTLAILVVYQSDFKVFFLNLGKKHDKNNNKDINLSDEELRLTVDEIIKACQTMSKSRTGALIVVAPNNVPTHILETGVQLKALVSSALLESIFNTKAPFHDGAVMVKNNIILAAGCFLPLSQTQSVAKNLGTRHRAGIGITEETDMLTIIVSEETGIISIAQKGELRRFVTSDRLRDILYDIYNISPTKKLRSL